MNVRMLLLAGIIVSVLGAATLMAGADKTAGAEYIGTAKCKMCHMKQYKTWEASKHSKNFASLVGDEVKNAACLACHTTGYGKGGYDVSKPAEHNAKFENTGCESCHGPGGKHFKAPMKEKKASINRTVTICSSCHNPHVKQGEMAKAKR